MRKSYRSICVVGSLQVCYHLLSRTNFFILKSVRVLIMSLGDEFIFVFLQKGDFRV